MSYTHIARRAIGVALALTLAPGAFALGTNAGDNITNTATVDYKVGTIVQPTKTSNTDDFEVDRRILFTVAETGNGNTSVTPNSTNQAVSFTVTNLSNDTVDFYLSVAQDGADDFDGAGTVKYYLDDGDGIFNGADTLVTYLDNVAEGAAPVVHVVYNMPSGLADGDLANVTLTATAASDASTAGNEYTESASDTANTVDTVLGDGAGVSDVIKDGKYSATDTYEVSTATITVTKSSRVISDPFNGTTNPKRIPGAVIEYCIAVENTGASAADTVTVTDAAPAGTSYVAGSIRTAVAGLTSATATDCDDTTGTSEDDNTTADGVAPGDELDPAGGSFAAGVITVNIEPSIATNGIARAAFRVTID